MSARVRRGSLAAARRCLRFLAWLSAACCCLGSSEARALGRTDAGTSGAQFLKIAPGARPEGMGEAFSGVADDVHAIYYNPAGLAFLKDIQVGAMHDSYFQGIRYEFGAITVPMLSWVDTKRPRNAQGVAGMAIYNLNAGGIERRGTTESDSPTDTFGASDFAYELAYGRALSERFAVGSGLKIVDQTLDSARAAAVSLDVGGLYREGKTSFGAGFRHLGTRPRFRSDSDPLPFLFYAGGSVRPCDDCLLAADLRFPRDNAVGLSLGGEYTKRFSQNLSGALRMGFSTANLDMDGLTGVSLGGGLGYDHWSFDFAWVPFGVLGDTFRYSLLVRF